MNNIDLVKALHQIWNTGDLTLIDSVYADDFLAHWPPSSEVPERRGIEGIRFGVGRIRTAFPDWHEQVMDVFGSGDRVASRYVSTGTHKGAFWGIEPTGRRIEIQEISIFRIAEDRIVEQWCMFDDLARLQQLGVVSVEHLREVQKVRPFPCPKERMDLGKTLRSSRPTKSDDRNQKHSFPAWATKDYSLLS
jgi:steroid delta-isomerase-like uncharacterized protein